MEIAREKWPEVDPLRGAEMYEFLCLRHYLRMRGIFDPGITKAGCFWDLCDVPDEDPRAAECIVWSASNRYCQLSLLPYEGLARPSTHLHRVVYATYALARGDDAWPEAVHHTCERKSCFNPRHLEGLTTSEHARRHFRGGGAA